MDNKKYVDYILEQAETSSISTVPRAMARA